MSIKRGPNIARNNLVFAYDIADRINSFIGEPTTNLANNLTNMGPSNSYIPVNTAAHSSIVQESTNIIQPPIKNLTVWKIYDSNPDGYSRFGIGQNGNVTIASFGAYDVTYVASIYVYIPSAVQLGGAVNCWATQNSTGVDWHTGNYSTPNPTYGYYSWDINTLNSEANLNIRDKWQRIFVRFTTSSIVRAYGGADNCKYLTVQFRPNLIGQNGSSFIYVSGFQLEQKSYPTPFSFSNRSVTQGLLNLYNNSNTIDLTNAGFDSSGDLYFNGSSNYIPVNQTLSTPITVSGYAKYTDQSKSYNSFFNGYPHNTLAISLNRNGAGNLVVYIGNGSTWLGTPSITSSSTVSVNTWYHITFTSDGITSILYLNGVNVGTSSNVPSGWGNYNYFGHLTGGVSSSEYFKGYINNAQIYNTALSAVEVLNNYKSTKSRFGL